MKFALHSEGHLLKPLNNPLQLLLTPSGLQ